MNIQHIINTATSVIVTAFIGFMLTKGKAFWQLPAKVQQMEERILKSEEESKERHALLQETRDLLLEIKEDTARIKEDQKEQADINNVLLFSTAALFDKTFKGIENGRKAKAEELLNNKIYHVN